MIRHFLTATISIAALAAAIPAAAQEAEDRSAPTMEFGTWGVDPALLDPAVDPGDDFFAYVNGKWIAENPIPPEYSRFGAFDILGERATADVEMLVADLVASDPAPGTQARRIVDSYQSYLDVPAIDAAGLVPAYPYLTAIYAAPDLAALTQLMAEPGYPGLVNAEVTVDEKDPESYAVSLGFNAMGLPDRDYYLVDNERNEAIRTAYKEYLTFLLGKAGYADPESTAQAVYNLEYQVAAVEWDRTIMRISELTYNKVSRDEVIAMAPGFPASTLLDAAGFGDLPSFIVPQIPPDAAEAETLGLGADALAKIGGGLPAMLELLSKTPLATIKALMAAQFLSSNASVLPQELDDANFAFYGTLLRGQEQQRPRWKRAIGVVGSQLGEQLGELFVERNFPPEAKAQMDVLVANLRASLAQSLAENDWMTPETKAQAEAKLASFTPKIGYPATFETYEGLDIAVGDPLGNRMRSIAWQLADDRAKLGGPVDKTEWGMLPQTVNAYYNPVFNEIVFPAAILRAPFFNPTADPAVNYGAIGAVIGHEIGHGFDDQGSKYDASGALSDWWQPADRAKFDELGDRLVAQYDGYCPYDDGKTCVNGRLTLGENIGDVGGLSMAYRAYRMSLHGEEAPVIDGLSGDQRFYLAWAQVWRAMQREAAERQQMITDPHSPAQYRVNGVVRNQDAWYRAFNVSPDDALYLPPEERVHIW